MHQRFAPYAVFGYLRPIVSRTLACKPTASVTRTLLIAALAAFVAACGLLPIAPPSMQDGRQLYLSACASCHGTDGTGDGPVTAALKTAPPDITRLAEQHGGQFPRELVIATIAGERNIPAHGTREMPVWSQRFGTGGSGAPAVAGAYARQQLEMLTDHLESMQRK